MITTDFLPEMPKFPEANCRDMINPDIFFPETKHHEAKSLPIVRIICSDCIHRKECLEYANAHQITHGIWGGLSPEERGVIQVKPVKQKRSFAGRIREMMMRGVAPETIAREVGVAPYYIRNVMRRARSKGEIQSDQSNQGSERSS